MDPLLLSRIQFGANISFHILFPTITIALGWVLLFFKFAYAKSGNDKWMDAYFFWVKIFALSFALGVVSGITMSFQFGTNWPGFMEKVGNIAGPLLAYEVMTAFFLEAVFLGIMLFGFRRVSNRVHTLATFLVAFGTTMSAFWIIALNSWMHTPQGFEIRDGVAHATDWWAIVFNPSMPYRLIHVLLSSGLTVSFLIAGISAYRWLRNDRSDGVRVALKTGTFIAAFLIPIQIFVGDLHGLNTLEHQPQKVAAMEGNWETGPNTPLLLFALPDKETRSNNLEIGVPSGASIILKHHPEGVVPGLNDYVSEEGDVLHPPVFQVFWAFRVMVGVGLAMLAISWLASFLFWRKGEVGPWVARGFVAMTFSGWLATLAGWYTTEIGRQPWLVDGVLKTSDAVADISGGMVLTTLLAYLAVYAGLTAAYVLTVFYLARKAGDRKSDHSEPDQPKPAFETAIIPAE